MNPFCEDEYIITVGVYIRMFSYRPTSIEKLIISVMKETIKENKK